MILTSLDPKIDDGGRAFLAKKGNSAMDDHVREFGLSGLYLSPSKKE
jgi:hypothetical protein